MRIVCVPPGWGGCYFLGEVRQCKQQRRLIGGYWASAFGRFWRPLFLAVGRRRWPFGTRVSAGVLIVLLAVIAEQRDDARADEGAGLGDCRRKSVADHFALCPGLRHVAAAGHVERRHHWSRDHGVSAASHHASAPGCGFRQATVTQESGGVGIPSAHPNESKKVYLDIYSRAGSRYPRPNTFRFGAALCWVSPSFKPNLQASQ